MKRFTFGILVVTIIACNEHEHTQMPLEGLWELEEWTATDSSGTLSYPYGENAIGLLLYDKNGSMTLTLSASERPTWGTFDHTSIDPQMVLNAFDNYFTYVGEYKVDWSKGIVEHHIEACLFPDWVGKVQERHFELKENKLFLSAYNKFGRDHKLTWVRPD